MDSTTSSERSKHSKKSSTKSMPANEETRLEILRKSKLISDESIREDVNNILELATRIFKVNLLYPQQSNFVLCFANTVTLSI